MDDLGVARERGRTELRHFITHALEHIAGRIDESAFRGVRDVTHEDEVAETFEEVDREAPRIVPGVHDLLDGAEQCCTVAGCQCVDGFVDQRDIGDAEQRQSARVGDALGACSREELVHDGQRVSGRTTSGPDDQRVYRVFDRHILLDADLLEEAPHRGGGEQPERVVVRS